MKNRIILLAIILSAISQITFAQEHQDEKKEDEQKTLFRADKHFGFYSAAGTKFTKVGSSFATMPYVKFAFSSGRVIALGIEACGLPPTVRNNFDGQVLRPLGGYAGFFFEPVIGSNRILHVTTPLMIGAGWFGFMDDWSARNDFTPSQIRDDSFVGIVEPSVLAELNVFRFMRFNLGASYRVTYNANFTLTDKKHFSGLNLMCGFKFGRF